MCEVSGGGGGEEKDKYHDHSKEARNVDSLKESLKVRSAVLLYQNHLEKLFLKMQDSGSYSTVPEFQSFGAGGWLAICILANTSISTAC